jgi:hypothetical protein
MEACTVLSWKLKRVNGAINMQARQISTEISFYLMQFYPCLLSITERWPDGDPLGSKHVVTRGNQS